MKSIDDTEAERHKAKMAKRKAVQDAEVAGKTIEKGLLIVNTGPGKGKSTAAFGLALRGWNQGWSIGIFQFVKSAKWRIGEQSVFERLGRLHDETGEGGPVEWHKMGSGWSWSRKEGTEEQRAAEREKRRYEAFLKIAGK